MVSKRKRQNEKRANRKMRQVHHATDWDGVANWYDGWVGQDGSRHHQQLAIPVVMKLLTVQPGEAILDIGCGQGVLAPYVVAVGGMYTGVDAGARLVALARKRHGQTGRFVHRDAAYLPQARGAITAGSNDAAVFLLSIQDMSPLDRVLASASWALKPGGRLVILMTHPCFRPPRQSGWGYDPQRKLRYRRVDSYLTAGRVPMKTLKSGMTHSFHRPLADYINALGQVGLAIDAMEEIATYKIGRTKAHKRANKEIPLFLGLRAIKWRK